MPYRYPSQPEAPTARRRHAHLSTGRYQSGDDLHRSLVNQWRIHYEVSSSQPFCTTAATEEVRVG